VLAAVSASAAAMSPSVAQPQAIGRGRRDQTVCNLHPRSRRRWPLQDDELLPQVEDLGLTLCR
jgi:hypothetical protein